MKQMIRSALDGVGLLPLARAAKRHLQATGLLPWTPLVPEVAFTECAIDAIQALQAHDHAFGDYVEFGVSRGTSMACMHKALSDCGVKTRLIGFDSFEGLGAEAQDSGWSKGEFASTEAATRRYLAGKGVAESDIVLIKGWFCDTATAETRARIGLNKISLLMIDADTYESSREGLAFGVSQLGDEMVVLFDDWGWSIKLGKRGQKEAFAEIVEANPAIRFTALPAYREEARVFLLTRV
jgi:O-methyltransferase